MSNLPSPLTDVLETTAVVRRELAAVAGHLAAGRWADAAALVDEAWTQLHELRVRFAVSLEADLDELDAAVGVLPGTSRQALSPGDRGSVQPLSPPAAAAPPGGLATEQPALPDVPLW